MSEKLFFENLNIISEKFPSFYFFIDKNYKKNNYEFPSIQIENLNLENIDILYLYKITNQIPKKIIEWLSKDKNKKLIIIEDDVDKLHFFLYKKLAKSFLNNDQISIHYLFNENSLNEIIYKNPSNLIDVITLDKKSEKFEDLKDEIIKKNISSFYQMHNSIYSYKHFKNFFKNIDLLKDSFLANDLKDSFDKFSAIIVGAGPSLKYSIEKLKTLKNKALIIACGSAITLLSKNNITPHLAILIDPNFDEFLRVKEAFPVNVPVIYSTRVNNGIFSSLNGPIGYLKAAINGFFEAYLEKKINITQEYVGLELDEKALSVTSIAIEYAIYLGCKNIILDGVDLAYSENKEYLSNLIKDKKVSSDPFEKKVLDISKNNERIYTNYKWQIEKECFSNIAKNHKDINFLNATKDGLKIDDFLDISYDNLEEKYLNASLDVSSYVHLLIENSKLEISNDQIEDIKKEIKDSFEKTISFLKTLINSKKEYEKILALSDLEEEIAYNYFLIEPFYTFSKLDEENKYIKLYELALNFSKILND
ncbi:MAG: hypothetical protein K1060chlam5_00675 [Candidatus Anoxychlamydiales bacterium]|nr:hypothetical protein [Candidatus Anoxychlamydiales bacterium]